MFGFLWLRSTPSKRRNLSFSEFGCTIESNSENETEKMRMLLSEFPSHQSLPLERKASQTDRSSNQRRSVKKGALKILANFTGKYLCQGVSIKKETLAQAVSCEFCKTLRAPIFTERLKGLLWINVTFFWLGVSRCGHFWQLFGWVWVGVGVCDSFLANCGWVWVSVTIFWRGGGECG